VANPLRFDFPLSVGLEAFLGPAHPTVDIVDYTSYWPSTDNPGVPTDTSIPIIGTVSEHFWCTTDEVMVGLASNSMGFYMAYKGTAIKDTSPSSSIVVTKKSSVISGLSSMTRIQLEYRWRPEILEAITPGRMLLKQSY